MCNCTCNQTLIVCGYRLHTSRCKYQQGQKTTLLKLIKDQTDLKIFCGFTHRVCTWRLVKDIMNATELGGWLVRRTLPSSTVYVVAINAAPFAETVLLQTVIMTDFCQSTKLMLLESSFPDGCVGGGNENEFAISLYLTTKP